jgi:hypothetical protein
MRTKTQTKPKPPTLRDIVFWFGLRAAAAVRCERFSRGGEKAKLDTAKSYRFALHVTGTAGGRPVDERIEGRLVREADSTYQAKPSARDLVAQAIAATPSEKRKALIDRLKRGTAKATAETLAAADAIIEARRFKATRSGTVRLAAKKN